MVSMGPGSNGDNSKLLRRRPIRGDRSRRSWPDKEEATLIVALKDLVVTGWKSDNGFRSGYLTRIEDALKRDFPNTDLRAQPHIQSKITTWKKFYSTLAMILDQSGVGFNNHGDYKIDCDDD
ncbi:hypothetical protein SASPL_108694 [Salvia splendens]|uniref:Myb/SANT-like domain-containing protein n=1 Tax=Salvia splendens TaxID=180675 RepID=A0A8X9A5M1_SALSN|nr:hypothetical protein SASPL_108694 [Salvia splendens]